MSTKISTANQTDNTSASNHNENEEANNMQETTKKQLEQ